MPCDAASSSAADAGVDGQAPVLEGWLRAQASPVDRDASSDYFLWLNRTLGEQIADDFQMGHSYFMRAGLPTAPVWTGSGATGRPPRCWRNTFIIHRDRGYVLSGDSPRRTASPLAGTDARSRRPRKSAVTDTPPPAPSFDEPVVLSLSDAAPVHREPTGGPDRGPAYPSGRGYMLKTGKFVGRLLASGVDWSASRRCRSATSSSC